MRVYVSPVDAEVHPGTRIEAEEVHLGPGTKIEAGCVIGPCKKFVTGDNCFIGHDSKLVAEGGYEFGDYVTLHNHLLSNGKSSVNIGHNVWVGQNCILNAEERLRLGNGVGIGTYSSVWTHGRHGELVEGCRLFSEAPVTLEDDAWLVGSYNAVYPGVTLGKKSVVLSGSVVTKNVPAEHVVAGVPAVDITDKMPPYRRVCLEDKWMILRGFVHAFEKQRAWSGGEVLLSEDLSNPPTAGEGIIFVKNRNGAPAPKGYSVFDLATKTYTKRRTPLEIAAMRFLLYPKARFIPEA